MFKHNLGEDFISDNFDLDQHNQWKFDPCDLKEVQECPGLDDVDGLPPLYPQ